MLVSNENIQYAWYKPLVRMLSYQPPAHASLVASTLLSVFQPAINTRNTSIFPNFSILLIIVCPCPKLDVFKGMSKCSSSAITNSYVSINFNNWLFFNQFKCIGTMLSKFELQIKHGEDTQEWDTYELKLKMKSMIAVKLLSIDESTIAFKLHW